MKIVWSILGVLLLLWLIVPAPTERAVTGVLNTVASRVSSVGSSTSK